MPVAYATVHGGRIECDNRLSLPDGTRLAFFYPDSDSEREQDNDLMSPEEIRHVFALMDKMEPIQMTDAELMRLWPLGFVNSSQAF